MKNNPDGLVTGNDYPSCGKIFDALPKPPLRRLLLRMLHPDPIIRITIEEALNCRFVKAIDCCCPDGKELSRVTNGIDASEIQSCKLAGKIMRIKHNHYLSEKNGKSNRQH